MTSPCGPSSALSCRPSIAGKVSPRPCWLEQFAYARKRGATLIEAYPVDKSTRSRDDAMWFGAKSMYDRAGFKEVARRKPARPVVRLKIK